MNENDVLKINDDDQTIGDVWFPDLKQFHVAKSIIKKAQKNGIKIPKDKLKQLAQENTFDVYPPSAKFQKIFDKLMAMRNEDISYSYDASDLIDELSDDIADYEFFEEKELVVWAYWTVMPNGQEVYVDYFYQDEDDMGQDGKKIADFDKEMAKSFDNFARKLMPAEKLLEILKEESQLF